MFYVLASYLVIKFSETERKWQTTLCVCGWSNSKSIWSVKVFLLYTYLVWLVFLFWLYFLLSLPPKVKRKTVDLKGELRTCSNLRERERERMLSSIGHIISLSNVTGFLFISDYLCEMEWLCVSVRVSALVTIAALIAMTQHGTVWNFCTRGTMAK